MKKNILCYVSVNEGLDILQLLNTITADNKYYSSLVASVLGVNKLEVFTTHRPIFKLLYKQLESGSDKKNNILSYYILDKAI